MDPEKIDEKRSEHSPDTRIDNLNYENSSSQAAIEQQKSASQPSGILGLIVNNTLLLHFPSFILLSYSFIQRFLSY
jgi:predicted ATP-grasp superfamily ATP-dependent carboligase